MKKVPICELKEGILDIDLYLYVYHYQERYMQGHYKIRSYQIVLGFYRDLPLTHCIFRNNITTFFPLV